MLFGSSTRCQFIFAFQCHCGGETRNWFTGIRQCVKKSRKIEVRSRARQRLVNHANEGLALSLALIVSANASCYSRILIKIACRAHTLAQEKETLALHSCPRPQKRRSRPAPSRTCLLQTPLKVINKKLGLWVNSSLSQFAFWWDIIFNANLFSWLRLGHVRLLNLWTPAATGFF